MSDERDKLIAKTQHFYEVLLKKKGDIDAEVLSINDATCRASFVLVADAYGNMVREYHKVFENFLYQE